MLPHRIALRITSTTLIVAALASAGIAIAGCGSGSDSDSSTSSNPNTAAQKTFVNSGNLLDVTDAPVSLPSEKVIYPPRTGNAGMAASHATINSALILLGVMAAVIAAARITTKAPSSAHRQR